MGYLQPAQIDQYHRDGFLIVQPYLTDDEIAAAQWRIEEIVREFDMSQLSIFSTTEQTKTSDSYFLESGDKIRCFFEEEAFNQQGNLLKPKELSINKVGHALHDLDDVFENISYKSELTDISGEVGMKDPLMVQSQYIFKQPGIGGKVVAHQDSTFIYTDPPSCIGFWMALENATVENGCLMAIPGSHIERKAQSAERMAQSAGRIAQGVERTAQTRRFVRNPDGKSTRFIGDDDQPWDLGKMVPLEVPAGALIILHGSLVHMSLHNRSASSRHAYIIHMVDADAHWPEDNWLQRPNGFPFRRLRDVV